MKVESKTRLRQLKAGVHLVCITDAVIIKDKDMLPLITPEGETGITVRFSTGDNLHYDQDYWLNGSRHSFFIKMCASANIDVANPKFRAESKGKRLWICIKELHDIDGDKPVVDDITGPSINYYLFDTIPCLDPNRKPVVKGNPDDNEGVASGAFLDYKQISKVIRDNAGDIIGAEHTEMLTIDQIIEKHPITEKQVAAITNVTGIPPKSDEPINWDEF